MGAVKHSIENSIMSNITTVDPGGSHVLLSNSSETLKPNLGPNMAVEVTTYTLVIVLLSVVVLLAIAFVLFGLFMKASAFTLTDSSRTPTGRHHHYLKGGMGFETGETAAFGPSGFGGFDE